MDGRTRIDARAGEVRSLSLHRGEACRQSEYDSQYLNDGLQGFYSYCDIAGLRSLRVHKTTFFVGSM